MHRNIKMLLSVIYYQDSFVFTSIMIFVCDTPKNWLGPFIMYITLLKYIIENELDFQYLTMKGINYEMVNILLLLKIAINLLGGVTSVGPDHTVPDQDLIISQKMTTMETWTFYLR